MGHTEHYYNNTNYSESHYRKEANHISVITIENFMYFFLKGYFYPYDEASDTFVLGYHKKNSFEYSIKDDPSRNNYHLVNHNNSFSLHYDNADGINDGLGRYMLSLYNDYKKKGHFYQNYSYIELLNMNESQYTPKFQNIFGMIADLHGEYIDNKYTESFGNVDTIEYMNWLGNNAFASGSDYWFTEKEMPSIIFTNVYDIFNKKEIIEAFKFRLLVDIDYIYHKCKIESDEKKEEILELINKFNFSALEYYFIDQDRCNYNLDINQSNDDIVNTLYNIIILDFLNNEDDNYLIEIYIKSILGERWSDDEKVIVSGNYYYRGLGHTIMGLGLLFSNLIRNEDMIGFLKGGNIMSFFEDMIFAFTGEQINISKKFYAEINNQNKIHFARLMLDKLFFNYISNESIFQEKITYHLIKKNILPAEYQSLGRSSIDRLKGGELLDILIENDSFYNHFGEESYVGILQEGEYPNALSPIDYIYHIRFLEDSIVSQYNNAFSQYNISTLLKEYKIKSDLIRYYYDNKYNYIVDNFLSNNTYFELTDTIVIESDYLSELTSIGVAPQGSCQSILHNTGYNHKLIGHILNPLTKLFIEIDTPNSPYSIDLENRQFILESGEVKPMYEFIRARVIGAIKEEGFTLQRYYGYSSAEFRALGEQVILEKYNNIGIELKEYSIVFDNELGINNYYSE